MPSRPRGSKSTARERLDRQLVERGLAPSRENAQALILAGEVSVAGETIRIAGQLVSLDAEIAVATPAKYVSRGGLKLEAALDAFALSPAGLVCADVGASTGGFTDVLLQRGAAKVFAIDVGRGQLAEKVRADPRVIVLDRTNARHLETLSEPIALCTIDVSFISLAKILPAAVGWLVPGGDIVAMVKPQFEAGPAKVGKGGVVRDPTVRAETVLLVAEAAAALGLHAGGVCPSPVPGPAGNREYFLLLRSDAALPALTDLRQAVDIAVTDDRAVVV